MSKYFLVSILALLFYGTPFAFASVIITSPIGDIATSTIGGHEYDNFTGVSPANGTETIGAIAFKFNLATSTSTITPGNLLTVAIEECSITPDSNGNCLPSSVLGHLYHTFTSSDMFQDSLVVVATGTPMTLIANKRYSMILVFTGGDTTIYGCGSNGGISDKVCTSVDSLVSPGRAQDFYTNCSPSSSSVGCREFRAPWFRICTTESDCATASQLDIGQSATAEANLGLQTCSGYTGVLDGSLCKTLAFLFLPSASNLERWSALGDTFKNTYPFQYLIDFQTLLGEFTGSSASTTATTTLDFNSFTSNKVNQKIDFLPFNLINGYPIVSWLRGFFLMLIYVITAYLIALWAYNRL